VPTRMTFQFLDVGMGDGTLVQVRQDGALYDTLILVDFGEKRTQFKVPIKDATQYLVTEIDRNSNRRGKPYPFIDYLFLTHSDGDHYNKIEELVTHAYNHYPGAQLHFGHVFFSGQYHEYGNLITELQRAGLVENQMNEILDDYHSPIAPDGTVTPEPALHGSVDLYVLSANWPKRNSPDKNKKSIVLAFDLAGQQVILPGDADAHTEKHILETFGSDFVSCTGLKLGHHGSRGASSAEWVRATSPKFIFASGDAVWSHPYCDTICRYVNHGSLKLYWNKNIYFCCGDAGSYYNNPTRHAVCMNLNYLVKNAWEYLIDSDNNHFIGYSGNTFGVQWALTITAGSLPELSVTTTVEPAPHQALPPPFVCKRVGDASGTGQLPGIRSVDNPFGH